MRNLFLHTVLVLSATLGGLAWAAPDKSLEDWTLEDVLTAVAEANGGLESIEQITNARFMGSVEGNVNNYEFVILKRRPDLIRSRMIVDDKVLETGYDGAIAWRLFEQGDYSKVEQVEDPGFVENLQIEADFDGPLIGPAASGVTRSLRGVERIDRIDYFVVEVSHANEVALHYIDSRTFREVKVVKTIDSSTGEPLVINTRFHEIENHNGIWVAKRVEKEFSNGNRELVFLDVVEMNLGILDFSFKMPGQAR